MNPKTKELFEKARNVPIVEAALKMGGAVVSGKEGQSRKIRIGDRLIIAAADGYAWFEVAGQGGKGAIDLVILCRGGDARSAINFLISDAGFSGSSFSFPISGVPGGSAASPAAAVGEGAIKASTGGTPALNPNAIPDPVEKNWIRVRTWLIETRGLDASIIDQLHERGRIYADDRNNTIFVGTAYGTTGCELRGTTGKRFAGRRGGQGLFILDEESTLSPIAVVESAIDAISLRMLGHRGLIVSTGGALKDLVIDYVAFLDRPTFAAFDNDAAGESYSRKLIDAIPRATRMRPGMDLKDWNDVLLSARHVLLEELSSDKSDALCLSPCAGSGRG